MSRAKAKLPGDSDSGSDKALITEEADFDYAGSFSTAIRVEKLDTALRSRVGPLKGQRVSHVGHP